MGEKLGVSNKAVSKWENGRSLPDPTLFQPLCDILEISLTELFNGERIEEQDVLEKSDEVLYDVLGKSRLQKKIENGADFLMAVAVVVLFLPALGDFERTKGILVTSAGLLILFAGAVTKLSIWQMIKNRKIENTGMGFTSALTVLFIVFKLLGYIDWPWIWVLSPIWIVILFIVALFGIILIAGSIKKKENKMLVQQLLRVWEKSVRETHLFLSDAEIKKIKEYVPDALIAVPILIVETDPAGDPVAFMGIDGHKLEMLFISPEERGRGIGRKMLEYGMTKYGVNELVVNEQNPQARGFYEHMGFVIREKSELDEQGNPYPILFMERG